jgi:hypothetical protein
VILTSFPNQETRDCRLENAQACESIFNGLPFSIMIRVMRNGLKPLEDSGFCGGRRLQVPKASNAFAKPSARGNQRVCNGMHCERNPILHSNLAHQLGYVRLDRALPDAQWDADFLVRSPFYQHL